MKTRSFLGRCSLAILALAAAGCVVDEANLADGERVGDTFMSFEDFEATVYREPETGVYIVDGDTPIEDREQLEAFYEQYVRSGALVVNQVAAGDDRWSDAQKLNLTYCVSTAFGGHYSTVVQAMQTAADAWQGAAYVKFVYQSAQDASCDANNTNVVFNVSPTSGQPYLARAFFPSSSRLNRNVMIDSSSFGAILPWTLAGILRHELGHTLGFRHEQIRPEAGAAACFEDYNWHALTPYDSASVMHYPQCNGSNSGDLVLTQRDKDGTASLYGTFSNWLSGWGDGNAFTGDFNGDGKSDWMRYDSSPLGWPVCLSNGTSFESCSNWLPGWSDGHALTGDFNGDGKSDWMRYDSSPLGWMVCLSNGTSFGDCSNWLPGVADSTAQVGDFNGDGKADLLRYTPDAGGWTVCLSNGTSFGSCSNWLPGWGDGHALTGDFNGDGKSDLLRYDATLSGWMACLSNGSALTSCSMYLPGVADSTALTGSFTGNGKADLAVFVNNPNRWMVGRPGAPTDPNSGPPVTTTPLTNNVSVSNLSGATHNRAYYSLTVPSGAANLVFQMSGGSGDSDLYVKFNSAPSLVSYDCRPYLFGNDETCTISNIQAGTYHVMLHAYESYSGVTLKGSFTPPAQ